jgi:hypothetical protein
MINFRSPIKSIKHHQARRDKAKQSYNGFKEWISDPNRVLAICTIFLVFVGCGALFISRDTEKRQLRAYVTPSNIKSDGTGSVLNIGFTVENFGQTPAKNCSIRGDAKVLPFPLPHRYIFQIPNAPFKQKTRVDPKIVSPSFVEMKYVLSDAHGVEILANDSSNRIYMFGVITYEDIFNDPHITNFCYFMELDPTPKKTRIGRPARTFKWADCDQHTDFN